LQRSFTQVCNSATLWILRQAHFCEAGAHHVRRTDGNPVACRVQKGSQEELHVPLPDFSLAQKRVWKTKGDKLPTYELR
jgi:hypothetical protein